MRIQVLPTKSAFWKSHFCFTLSQRREPASVQCSACVNKKKSWSSSSLTFLSSHTLWWWCCLLVSVLFSECVSAQKVWVGCKMCPLGCWWRFSGVCAAVNSHNFYMNNGRFSARRHQRKWGTSYESCIFYGQSLFKNYTDLTFGRIFLCKSTLLFVVSMYMTFCWLSMIFQVVLD